MFTAVFLFFHLKAFHTETLDYNLQINSLLHKFTQKIAQYYRYDQITVIFSWFC